MSLYDGFDLSLYDYGFSDPAIVGPLSRISRLMPPSYTAIDDDDDYDRRPRPRPKRTTTPPKHRQDGTSPLPLGMDWSLPPRVWDGRDSVWPHNSHSGWSYCVTIPSWTVLPHARGSDFVVFYRVQVGIQSPEGVTTTRGVLRRFSDFLNLFSELSKVFPHKKLPPAPPRRLLKMRSRALLEERRCALEDWMEKLLSDIDLSRSASVAIFLELEAAARSSFYDSNENVVETNSATGMVPSHQFPPNPGAFLVGSSSITSDFGNDSAYETSELGTPRHGRSNYAESNLENASDKDVSGPSEETVANNLSGTLSGSLRKDFLQGNQVRFSRHKMKSRREISGIDTYIENGMDISSGLENSDLRGHIRRISNESIESDVSSIRASETSSLGAKKLHGYNYPEGSEASRTTDIVSADLQFPADLIVALPSEERHKMNRVLMTMQHRLRIAKMDMEDLIARFNQETVVRQYLATKVKDLEVELETTRHSDKENLQQAVLIERERFTQMQWDAEELRRKCMEMELKLMSEKDVRVRLESTKASIIREHEMLLQELDIAREHVRNIKKHYDELELKSKSDVKLLVKEVKSLRSSHSELKQELSRCLKEKLDLESELQKQKQRWKQSHAAKAKLLHECEILRNRLQECSVNFLNEEEDQLIMDTSSSSDAIDLLATSDNRIGLLLAEAQLLAQDVQNAIAVANQNVEGDDARKLDDDLSVMLTDIFIDNANLRKQVNSVIRCALSTPDKTDEDDLEDDAPSRTVLSKFL